MYYDVAHMFAFCVFSLLTTKLSFLVPNKRKASKVNQCFVSIIHITEANNVSAAHVATDANDDHYHLFTDILLVKIVEAQLTAEIVMVIAPLTAILVWVINIYVVLL